MTQILYFVECDFGNGKAFLECDRDRSSFKQVIDDIVSGEVENVLTVLEVIEGEKSCRDVTEDVARAVRDRILNEQLPLEWDMANFLHGQLGVGSIAWPRAAE